MLLLLLLLLKKNPLLSTWHTNQPSDCMPLQVARLLAKASSLTNQQTPSQTVISFVPSHSVGPHFSFFICDQIGVGDVITPTVDC